jgi:hypothetical protein
MATSLRNYITIATQLRYILLSIRFWRMFASGPINFGLASFIRPNPVVYPLVPKHLPRYLAEALCVAPVRIAVAPKFVMDKLVL